MKITKKGIQIFLSLLCAGMIGAGVTIIFELGVYGFDVPSSMYLYIFLMSFLSTVVVALVEFFFSNVHWYALFAGLFVLMFLSIIFLLDISIAFVIIALSFGYSIVPILLTSVVLYFIDKKRNQSFFLHKK